MMTGMSLLEAMLGAPLIGISVRHPKVLHAVEMEEVCRTWFDGGTVIGACGRQRLRIMAQDDLLLPWPPALKGLDRVRCRECWEETGKMRPRVRSAG